MTHASTVTLKDQEVLKRVQHLGDALAASIAQKDPPHLNPYHVSQYSQDDWKQQVKLLKETALLVSDDDVASRPAFVGWMSLYLKNPLTTLLESRRPAVALAAMAVLDCLVLRVSSTNRTAVATVCAWFLDLLLRIAASPSSTTTTVASTAAALLSAIAGTCLVTLEGLNVLCIACAAARASVRRCAMSALQTYLQAVRGTAQQLAASAYADALHRVVRDGVADADAAVRAGARRCFWALHLLDPASAATLLRVLPSTVRRQLMEEREAVLTGLHAVMSAADRTELDGNIPESKKPAVRLSTSSSSPPTASAATVVSRTVTLKDELQAAAASRARARRSRSLSPSLQRRHLLLTSKDLPYDPDRRSPNAHQARSPFATVAVRRQVPLLHSIESTDWSVRRAALLQAAQLCQTHELADDVADLLEALVARLGDTHFRVIEAAQACLQVCLQVRPAAAQEALRELLADFLPALFRNTTHTKVTVRHGAYILLDTLLRQHDAPAKLLGEVLRVLDGTRDGGVEEEHLADFFLYAVFVYPTLFAQKLVTDAVVRCAVAHLAALQADASLTDHTAAARAAGVAWSKLLAGTALACPDVFCDVAGHLSTPEKETLLCALRDCFGVTAEGENGVGATDSDASFALPTELRRCVFAEQVRDAYAAEHERQPSGNNRKGRASARSTASKAVAVPALSLRFTPPPVLPSILKDLLFPVLQPDQAAGAGPSAAPLPAARGREEVEKDTREATYRAPLTVQQTPSPKAAEPPEFTRDTARLEMQGGNIEAGALNTIDEETFPRNAPAAFLREWPACRDASTRRAALLRLAAACRYYTSRQRNSLSLCATDGGTVATPQCDSEDAERLLLCWEQAYARAESGGDHVLRWAILHAMESLLLWPAARSAVARQLTRVLLTCRMGLDDAFVEVQLQAAACVQAALLQSKLPLDLCFSALAASLTKWIEGPQRDDTTPGWLELLHMLRRLLEERQGTQLNGMKAPAAACGGLSDVEAGTDTRASGGGRTVAASLTLSSSVLRRVVAVVRQSLHHCNPVVRLSSVLVLVALQRVMGVATTAPFLSALTPAQHRVLSVYYAKETSPLDPQPCF